MLYVVFVRLLAQEVTLQDWVDYFVALVILVMALSIMVWVSRKKDK